MLSRLKLILGMFALSINVMILIAVTAIVSFQWNEARAEQRLKHVTSDDVFCLQQNIYFEARNQSVLGQVAVAWVTLNRMTDTSYPNSVCKVVWQNKQFSWTHDGKSDKPGKTKLEQRAWEDAGLVAQIVLLDWARANNSPISEAIMYHANYVDPYWADSYVEVIVIDDHIFYEKG